MPSSRRLPPTGSQPPRRPKVAGLRRPAGTETRPENAKPAVTDEAAAEQEATTEPEPAEATERPEAPDTETPEVKETPEQDVAPSGEPSSSAPKPGPRRKVRDTGVPKPESEGQVETATEAGPKAAAKAGAAAASDDDGARPNAQARRGRGYALVVMLLVGALVFAGLAVFFKYRESEARAATDNMALVDVAATAQAKDAMSKAAERLFSVDYNDLAKTENAAKELLVNDEVRQQYEQFMGEFKRRAPDQQLVVTVEATRSAVVNLQGDRAKVMVYVDQSLTRASDNENAAASAALWFMTERRGDQWKITNMNSYSEGRPASQQQQQQSEQQQQPEQQQQQQGGN